MSIETIADVTAPLRTYAALLEGRAGDLHQSLLSYYERERGMHEHISVKLDDNRVAIAIPSLKFYCLSRNRLAFVGKDLVAEIEFFTGKDDQEISILKCYLSTEGKFSFCSIDNEPQYDFYHDRTIEPALFGQLFRAASAKKIISI